MDSNYVNLDDFAALSKAWQPLVFPVPGLDPKADLNGDGFINFDDLVIFTSQWLCIATIPMMISVVTWAGRKAGTGRIIAWETPMAPI